MSLPYVADDSLLCKLGSGVCPSLKHLDVQVTLMTTNDDDDDARQSIFLHTKIQMQIGDDDDLYI